MVTAWLWHGYGMGMVWVWHGYGMGMAWVWHTHTQVNNSKEYFVYAGREKSHNANLFKTLIGRCKEFEILKLVIN